MTAWALRSPDGTVFPYMFGLPFLSEESARHSLEKYDGYGGEWTLVSRESDDDEWAPLAAPAPRACRICGCTDGDCSGCVKRTGRPCHWIELDLCSACTKGES